MLLIYKEVSESDYMEDTTFNFPNKHFLSPIHTVSTVYTHRLPSPSPPNPHDFAGNGDGHAVYVYLFQFRFKISQCQELCCF